MSGRDPNRPPGWRRVFRLPVRGRRSVEQAVDDELSFHLAMRAEKIRRSGAGDFDAQRAALARFGDAHRVRQECIDIDQQYAREVQLMEWLESLVSDFRYGLRTPRQPA